MGAAVWGGAMYRGMAAWDRAGGRGQGAGGRRYCSGASADAHPDPLPMRAPALTHQPPTTYVPTPHHHTTTTTTTTTASWFG